MKSRISEILEKIDRLKQDLYKEYERLSSNYDFFIKNKKIIFSEKIKSYQKSRKENLFHYIFTADIRNILSMPFIYGMIFPAVFLDLFLTLYNFTALPLYGIPGVKRKDHFIYDRRFLKYLNLLQKLNCLYCAYMNGLFSFATEIGARTEQYWCPIKHAIKNDSEHKYFKYYADFGDTDGFNEIFSKNTCFKK
ncbi:MAG: hypothetical protein PHS92_01745 [Candidatus Gracilibacteria bacterium]|nr:hypothetical protein [Candidatus Gracilibacteria bacterium]